MSCSLSCLLSLKLLVSLFILIPFSSLKKEMQNIAIRASPLRSHSSVTGSKQKSDGNRNIVTVNGCATKNSSIIYLSPDMNTSSGSGGSQEIEYPEYPGDLCACSQFCRNLINLCVTIFGHFKNILTLKWTTFKSFTFKLIFLLQN